MCQASIGKPATPLLSVLSVVRPPRAAIALAAGATTFVLVRRHRQRSDARRHAEAAAAASGLLGGAKGGVGGGGGGASHAARSPGALLPSIKPLPGPEWEIPEADIQICKRPDGSDWLLGEGSFGQVFKAIKGGVQVRASAGGRGSVVSGRGAGHRGEGGPKVGVSHLAHQPQGQQLLWCSTAATRTAVLQGGGAQLLSRAVLAEALPPGLLHPGQCLFLFFPFPSLALAPPGNELTPPIIMISSSRIIFFRDRNPTQWRCNCRLPAAAGGGGQEAACPCHGRPPAGTVCPGMCCRHVLLHVLCYQQLDAYAWCYCRCCPTLVPRLRRWRCHQAGSAQRSTGCTAQRGRGSPLSPPVSHTAPPSPPLQEIALMKYVSRDANITQVGRDCGCCQGERRRWSKGGLVLSALCQPHQPLAARATPASCPCGAAASSLVPRPCTAKRACCAALCCCCRARRLCGQLLPPHPRLLCCAALLCALCSFTARL